MHLFNQPQMKEAELEVLILPPQRNQHPTSNTIEEFRLHLCFL